MREVYVYDEFCNDFDNLGLVGALTPTSCEHEEIAGGMSEVVLVHPIDETGKYKALEKGRILKCIVPVRTTPEIDGTTVVTTVEKWHVDPLSTKAQRKVWSKREEGKKLGSLKANDKVIVVKRNNTWDRYKIKAKKLNGWFDKTALVFEASETLPPDDPTAIEDIYPLWGDKEQLFRIYAEDRSDTEITVHARHISYDMLTNMTMYKDNGEVSLATAVNGVFTQCVDAHEFTVQTNVADERTGVDYRHNNPINALFDPEEGILKRWDVQLVRDDYELTILKTVGKNRGMSIEYGRNLTGVTCTIDTSNVVTCVLPTGVDHDGKPLYLTDDVLVNGHPNLANYVFAKQSIRDMYPFEHVYHLECEDATEGSEEADDKKKKYTPNKSKVRERMLDQAYEVLWEDKAHHGDNDQPSANTMPTVSLQVEFVTLGDTEEYKQFKDLERLFLYDKVRVRVPKLNIDMLLDAVRVKTDCLTGHTVEVEIGAVTDIEVSVPSWAITSLNGGKIVAGSIPAGSFGKGVITADAIFANAITADKIAANTITADKMSANEGEFVDLVAENLTAQSIRTEMIEAGEGYFGQVVAGNLTNETMRSKLASISVLDAAQAMLGNTVIDSATFKDAFTAYLNVDHLFVNDLWLKDSQQQLRQIEVDATTGAVKAGSLLANKTINGSTLILDSSINAAQLNASEIFANSAIISALTTSSIWASSGWIAQLQAASVMGGGFLQLSSGTDYNTYIQETDPQTQGLELNVGDVWVRINSDKYQCRTWGGSAWEVVGDDSTNEPHGSTPPTNPSYLTIWVDVAHSRVWRYWDDNWHEFGGSHTFNSTENPGRSVVRSDGSASIRQYSHPRVGDIWNDPKEGVSYRTLGSRRWVLTGRKLFWQTAEPTQRATGVPIEIGDIWLHGGNRDMWNGAGWERYTTGVYGQDDAPSSPGEGWLWADTDGTVITVAANVTSRPVYEFTRWRRFTTKTFKQTFEPLGELIDGDTWINGSAVYTYNGSAWQREQYSYYQSTEPANPKQGEVWCDSTTGRTYTWSGSAWVRTKPYATSGSRAPTDPAPINGDTWFCTETHTSGGYTYYAGCSYEYGGGWKVRNGELHNSTVNITSQLVSIHTPAFEVDIQHSDSAETTELRVDQDGVSAEIISANQTIAAPAMYADNVQETYTGPNVIQAAYNTIDEIVEGLNGKHLAEDVVIKLPSANNTQNVRPYLHDISGAKLIFTPNNLLSNPWYAASNSYNNTKNYRCTATGNLSSMTLTNTSAVTNNYHMRYIGNVGAMGLRGKQMRFATKVYGTGDARYELLVGKALPSGGIRATVWWGASLSKGTSSSNAVLYSTVFNLNYDQMDSIEDCDLFLTLWCGRADASTASGTSITYMNTALEIGDTFGKETSEGMSDLIGNGAGLQLSGCDVHDCQSEIVFSQTIMLKYARMVNSNVSFNMCRFPSGTVPSGGTDGTIMGSASIEQFGGRSGVYSSVGGSSSMPFARVRGGGTMTIEGGIRDLDGNAGYRPAGTTTGNVVVIGTPNTSNDGSAPDASTTYTKTYPATDHDTYWGSWASSDNDLRTGSISAHANMVGWCTFNTSNIPSGATIQSATLKIKRMSGYGVSGKVDLLIRKSNDTTKPSGKPNETGTAITLSDFISEGETKKANVASLVSTNARSAFVFKVDDESVMTDRAYSANFARYKGSALELTVTYTV